MLTKITRVEVLEEGKFKDSTTLELVDEGGGDFLTITQYDDLFNPVVIRLSLEELPHIYKAINLLCNQLKTT